MKLLTKKLLVVAMAVAMTLGMAMTAMAEVKSVPESVLNGHGFSVDDDELDMQDIKAADENGSPKSVPVKFGGNYGDYARYGIFHHKADGTWEYAEGKDAIFNSNSPFYLVGQKKAEAIDEAVDETNDAVVADEDDDDDDSSSSSKKISSSSSSSSSSSKKSPKTGMEENWMLWLMAAGLFAGASVVSYNRKRG